MGIPGSGKKAINTRVQNIMREKGITESEAKLEISRQMRSIGSKGGKNGSGPEYRAGGDKAAGFAHPDHDPQEYGRRGGLISRRTKNVQK